MSLPRLVATDLDGTLLRSDGTWSPRTERVLGELERRGVPVVIVTARPIRWMADLLPLVGHSTATVVSNGAVVYDAHAAQVLELTGIGRREGLALLEAISAAVPGATYALECESGIVRDPRFVEPHPFPEGSPVGELAELWTEPAVKVMVRHPHLDDDEFRERTLAAVGGRGNATWSVPDLVEIGPPGVDKATTLARVAAGLGIAPQETLAFGDMPNDLPMLRWAGTSYAVANAHPSVLAAADHVAPPHDDDGVALVLARTFRL